MAQTPGIYNAPPRSHTRMLLASKQDAATASMLFFASARVRGAYISDPLSNVMQAARVRGAYISDPLSNVMQAACTLFRAEEPTLQSLVDHVITPLAAALASYDSLAMSDPPRLTPSALPPQCPLTAWPLTSRSPCCTAAMHGRWDVANEIEGVLDLRSISDASVRDAAVRCPGRVSQPGWNARCRFPLRSLQRLVNRVAAAIKAVAPHQLVTAGAWNHCVVCAMRGRGAANLWSDEALRSAGGRLAGTLDVWQVHASLARLSPCLLPHAMPPL
jgi:hypothetical protein